MNKQVLYNALVNKDYKAFKDALKRDLDEELTTNILENEDYKMTRRYDRGNHLSRYIRNVVRESEDAEDTQDIENTETDKEEVVESICKALKTVKKIKHFLREADADTDDVEDIVDEVEDEIDGDTEDDVAENMRHAKRKVKEAEQELSDVDVDDDDEQTVESLKKAYRSLKTVKRLIEDIEDGVEKIDDIENAEDIEEEDEIEGSTDDVKESRRSRSSRRFRSRSRLIEDEEIEGSTDDVKDVDDIEEDDEIEGSTDDVKESIRTIVHKLREAEAEIDDVDKENTETEECLNCSRRAYTKVKNAMMAIKHLNNMKINENHASLLKGDAVKVDKVAKIFEELDDEVDPNRDDEVKEAAINFKKAIAKAINILECGSMSGSSGSKKMREENGEDELETDKTEITESYSSSLIKRMNRLI